jgi:hypothetical protein
MSEFIDCNEWDLIGKHEFIGLVNGDKWTTPIFYSSDKTLCYEYKNATSLEEANARYVTIHYWWYLMRPQVPC